MTKTMRIYDTMERRSNHRVFVTPAKLKGVKKESAPSEWYGDEDAPVTFTVEFRANYAVVDEPLGKIMVENGLARKTRLAVDPHYPAR